MPLLLLEVSFKPWLTRLHYLSLRNRIPSSPPSSNISRLCSEKAELSNQLNLICKRSSKFQKIMKSHLGPSARSSAARWPVAYADSLSKVRTCSGASATLQRGTPSYSHWLGTACSSTFCRSRIDIMETSFLIPRAILSTSILASCCQTAQVTCNLK